MIKRDKTVKQFSSYLNEVNYNEISNAVKPIYIYAAYKNGEVKIFDTYNEATKFSKNCERICTNKEEYEANIKLASELWDTAIKKWETDLRKEYSYVDEELYNMVYSKVYDEHHSNIDEMANHMINEIDHALRIVKYVKDLE